jgi:hypothetical protein
MNLPKLYSVKHRRERINAAVRWNKREVLVRRRLESKRERVIHVPPLVAMMTLAQWLTHIIGGKKREVN